MNSDEVRYDISARDFRGVNSFQSTVGEQVSHKLLPINLLARTKFSSIVTFFVITLFHIHCRRVTSNLSLVKKGLHIAYQGTFRIILLFLFLVKCNNSLPTVKL